MILEAGTYRFNDVIVSAITNITTQEEYDSMIDGSLDTYQNFTFTDANGTQYTSIASGYADGLELSISSDENFEIVGTLEKFNVLSAITDNGTEIVFYEEGKIRIINRHSLDGQIISEMVIEGEGWYSESYKEHTIPTQEVSEEFYEWYIVNTNYLYYFKPRKIGSPNANKTANVWKEPIFDRTLDDVEFAIRKIEEWKKNHTHTTDIRVEDDTLFVRGEDEGVAYVENDVLIVKVGDVYELKGCLNLLDLNRIESNIAFLAEKMESYSYAPNIHGKQWSNADMPNQNDMSRIIDNIRSLISSFYSPDNPPSLPTTMLSYNDINAIEENLYLIKELLDCMASSFKKVGTIKSGSTTFLPLRR